MRQYASTIPAPKRWLADSADRPAGSSASERRGEEIIRVLVVDDHPVVSEGVATLVRDSSIQVVGSAITAAEAFWLARDLQPDVILLDVRVGEMLGSALVEPLLSAARRARILMFTAFPEHPSTHAALEAGAEACVVKDTNRTDLVQAITQAARAPASVRMSARIDASLRTTPELTTREQEILNRVALGRTNAEIADELCLAPATVKTYWQNALRKLAARNRAEAITRAYQVGLL